MFCLSILYVFGVVLYIMTQYSRLCVLAPLYQNQGTESDSLAVQSHSRVIRSLTQTVSAHAEIKYNCAD